MSFLGRVVRRAKGWVNRPLLIRRMKRLGISYFPPNYTYFDTFTDSSVVADVGCGYEAEFSRHVIETHGLRAFGVDPTRKHLPFLQELVRTSDGRFTHLPLAVSRLNGKLTFHESRQNESGSLLAEHVNVRQDETIEYEVESVSLSELTRRIGSDRIDLLKLDLEGAEYDLLQGATAADLRPFDQLFVEFHHHCTDHTVAETRQAVERLAASGYKVFTLDEHNFLFYR